MLKGHLVEVVLDGGEDPIRVVRALGEVPGRRMGLTAWCPAGFRKKADTWYSIQEAIHDYPISDDVDLWVVVVDPGVAQGTLHGLDPVRLARLVLPIQANGMVDLGVVQKTGFKITEQEVVGAGGRVRRKGAGVEVDYATVEGILTTRPKVVPDWWNFDSWGLMPQVARAMGGLFWDSLEAMRATCEASGANIVLVTTDLRPQGGRGPLERSHFFRDTRVRSWLGDAGRYLTHMRYLVEHDEDREWWRVVATKDEAEGRVGRILFEGPILSKTAAMMAGLLGAASPRSTPMQGGTPGEAHPEASDPSPALQSRATSATSLDLNDTPVRVRSLEDDWSPERVAEMDAALEKFLE